MNMDMQAAIRAITERRDCPRQAIGQPFGHRRLRGAIGDQIIPDFEHDMQ